MHMHRQEYRVDWLCCILQYCMGVATGSLLRNRKIRKFHIECWVPITNGHIRNTAHGIRREKVLSVT